MSPNPEAIDWAGARGERWASTVSGMEATLAPVDAPLLDALAPAGPSRIAEIGSGGGGTALAALAAAPRGSVVHGYDVSPRLVEVARARIPDGETRVRFEVADAGRARPPAPYDRLLSRFGVMFFDDPPAAFANLRPWLVPGGRFAFAVWAAPADNPWLSTVRDVIAGFVDVPRPDPTAPGPFRYADVATLRALLVGAGFADVDSRLLRTELALGGGLPPAAAADFALTSFSAFADLLAAAGPDVAAAARSALVARYEALGADVVRYPAAVHLVTGAA